MKATILVSTTFLLLLVGASADTPEPVGYLAASPVPLEGRPWMMASGDLDGDGLIDLVTADPRESEFIVHRQSRGPTSYRFDATTVETGFDPDRVFVAHLDDDDLLDVLVLGRYGSVAVVFRNRGGLAFEPVVTEADDRWDEVDLADADGDGDLDLVYESADVGDLWCLENDGEGAFTRRPYLETRAQRHLFRVGDVNLDGRPDIVVERLHVTSNRLELRLAVEGGFALPVLVDDYPRDDVRLADLDGDGDLDVVTARQGAGTPEEGIRVILGNGDGTFAAPTPYDMPANGSVVVGRRVWTVDVDEDGYLDLLTDVVTNGVSILLNRGDGTFGEPHEYRLDPVYPTERVHDLAVFPLGADPRPDVLVAASTHTSGTLSELPILYELDRGGPAPPSISGLSPITIRAGDTRTLEVTGERFDVSTRIRLDERIAAFGEEVLAADRMTVTVQPEPVGLDDPYLRDGFRSTVVAAGTSGGQRLDDELTVTPFWDFGLRSFSGKLRDRSKRRGDRFKVRAKSTRVLRAADRHVPVGEDLRILVGDEDRAYEVSVSGDDPRWKVSSDGRFLRYRTSIWAKPNIRFKLDVRQPWPEIKLELRHFDFPGRQTGDVWVRVFLGDMRFASHETWFEVNGRYRPAK